MKNNFVNIFKLQIFITFKNSNLKEEICSWLILKLLKIERSSSFIMQYKSSNDPNEPTKGIDFIKAGKN